MENNRHLIPSFFIIGERKCGTSSLFRYICNHPLVVPGILKEPNFFINSRAYIQSNFNKYQRNFPEKTQGSIELNWPELDQQGLLYNETIPFPVHPDSMTGEASANTFVDVEPSLLKEFLPKCKLIILLRDPISRAISHYKMYERFINEGRSIGFELYPFDQMMEKEMINITQGLHSPILYPSLYIKSLPGWMDVFGESRILLLQSHELALDPSNVMSRVFKFLELPFFKQHRYTKYNAAPLSNTTYVSLNSLKEFVAPFNQSLFKYLGENNPWD